MSEKLEWKFTLEVFEQNELSASDQELLAKAQEATDNSYAPYSNFNVGTALRLANGTIILGTNQENAAYPSGLCAERTAIFYAGSTYPDQQIESIAITARRADSNTFLPVSSCGGCRQVLIEYETRQGVPIRIIMQGKDNRVNISDSAANLLPMMFTGKDLHKP
jgi:cytidine deaminase